MDDLSYWSGYVKGIGAIEEALKAQSRWAVERRDKALEASVLERSAPKTGTAEECGHWDYVQVAHARWCIYCGALWRQHPGWILPRRYTHD